MTRRTQYMSFNQIHTSSSLTLSCITTESSVDRCADAKTSVFKITTSEIPCYKSKRMEDIRLGPAGIE